MASMNGAQFDVDGVSRSLRAGLLNRQLSDICRAESLATNGVKAELQARITASELPSSSLTHCGGVPCYMTTVLCVFSDQANS